MRHCKSLSEHVAHLYLDNPGPSLEEFTERARREWDEEQREALEDHYRPTLAETSPGYRQAMRDAGRGSMLR